MARLQLPARLRIELYTDDAGLPDLANILVCVEFHHDGRYYYGAVLGLSGADGTLEATRDAILADFQDAQRDGIAEHALPLEEVEAGVTLRIIGGGDFRLGQILVPGSVRIVPRVRRAWEAAINTDLTPSSQEVLFDTPRDEVVLRHLVRSGPAGRGARQRLQAKG